MHKTYTDNPLRAARLQARVSQEELAARAGVSRDSVYRAEKPGAAAPSFRVQRRIAEVLGMAPDVIWPETTVEPAEAAA